MMRVCFLVALAVSSAVIVMGPRPVHADAVVGRGTPASCTEAALNAALMCNPSGLCSGNGNVTFSCGGGPVTITITSLEFFGGQGSIDGGGLVTLDGGGTTPLFVLSGTLSLSNLIISGFKGGTAGVISITDGGTLTVTNSTFSGNHGITSGAIFSSTGTLTVTNSTFSGNSANGGLGGGAIYSGSTLTVTNSTFTDNSAIAGHGGAILSSGTLTVINSTFTDNSASYVDGLGGSGGAVATINAFAAVNVTNSTFSGNSANHGGAIYWSGNPLGPIGHPVTVTNSIFSNSTGGNCYVKPDSIIVGGTGNTGVITDGGYNLEDGESCAFRTANESMSNTNPGLDPAGLANNGGPTQTISLCTGPGVPGAGCTGASPAIDAGDPFNYPATDQRGAPRPYGVAPDIGAFEGIGPGGTRTPSPNPVGCAGDCSGDDEVTVDELVRGVNIALGSLAFEQCPVFDSNKDGGVTVDELVRAVNAALTGC